MERWTVADQGRRRATTAASRAFPTASGANPTTSTSFVRWAPPETSRTDDLGTPTAVATSSTTASLARPRSAAAVTATLKPSPWRPTTRVDGAPGCTWRRITVRSSTRAPYDRSVPFGPVAPFDLVALEERVLARWREDDVVEQVRKGGANGEPWIFYEGPPTA